MVKKMKCKNCGCRIDLFIGKETKARACLHVINCGTVFAYVRKSRNGCTKPMMPSKELNIKI